MRSAMALCRAFMVMAIVGVASAAAAEADLSGKWQLEIVSPQGTRTPTMTLKQTGTQVYGHVQQPARRCAYRGLDPGR